MPASMASVSSVLWSQDTPPTPTCGTSCTSAPTAPAAAPEWRSRRSAHALLRATATPTANASTGKHTKPTTSQACIIRPMSDDLDLTCSSDQEGQALQPPLPEVKNNTQDENLMHDLDCLPTNEYKYTISFNNNNNKRKKNKKSFPSPTPTPTRLLAVRRVVHCLEEERA
jgi:hypothetical protein